MLLDTLLNFDQNYFDLILVDKATVLLVAHMDNTPLIVAYRLPRPVNFEVSEYYIHNKISNNAIRSIILGSLLILRENLSVLHIGETILEIPDLFIDCDNFVSFSAKDLRILLKLVEYPRRLLLNEVVKHADIDKIVFNKLFDNCYSASYITATQAVTATIHFYSNNALPTTFELSVDFLLLMRDSLYVDEQKMYSLHFSAQKSFYFEVIENAIPIRIMQENTANAPYRTVEGGYIPDLYHKLYGDVFNQAYNYGSSIEITFKLKDFLKNVLKIKRFYTKTSTYIDYLFIHSHGGANLIINGDEDLPTVVKNMEIPNIKCVESTNLTYASCINLSSLLGFLDAVKDFDKNQEMTILLFNATEEMYADTLTSRKCFIHLSVNNDENIINYTPTSCFAHFSWLLNNKKGLNE